MKIIKGELIRLSNFFQLLIRLLKLRPTNLNSTCIAHLIIVGGFRNRDSLENLKPKTLFN